MPKRPTLIDGAGKVWHRFWSVRFSLLAAVLGAIELGLPFFAPERRSPLFGVLTVVAALAAAWARVVKQREVGDKHD